MRRGNKAFESSLPTLTRKKEPPAELAVALGSIADLAAIQKTHEFPLWVPVSWVHHWARVSRSAVSMAVMRGNVKSAVVKFADGHRERLILLSSVNFIQPRSYLRMGTTGVSLADLDRVDQWPKAHKGSRRRPTRGVPKSRSGRRPKGKQRPKPKATRSGPKRAGKTKRPRSAKRPARKSAPRRQSKRATK